MLYLGGDHAGYKLKEQIKKYLAKKEIGHKDLGPTKLVPTDDYPDYGFAVAKKVVSDPKNRGILICGSSAGVCIVANKVKGIRAAQAHDEYDARMARTDDDANVLCLAGRELNIRQARKLVELFLQTPFSGASRHKRRIKKIRKIENTLNNI